MRVLLVTWPNGFFGSSGSSWESLDVGKIKAVLWERLSSVIPGLAVDIVPIDKLLNEVARDCLVVYCSADSNDLRDYIKDHIHIASQVCEVVPSFEHLMAHENKGYQALYRDLIGIEHLNGSYHVSKEDLIRPFPYVYKTVGGAGGTGVRLISGNLDVASVMLSDFRVSFFRAVKNLIRRLHLSKQRYDIYKYRYSAFRQWVQQEYIEELDGDYKVLVFGEKYYPLRRYVRKGGFKASGSGLIAFDTPPVEVLYFSKKIYESLNCPYVSLDIAMDGNVPKLIEYQGLNFGPKAVKLSKGYWALDSNWSFVEEEPVLEREFALALAGHILGKSKFC